MKAWFRSLSAPPPPLSARERALVLGLSLAAALSRFAALALTPWDWDEMLFLLAMRHYDVAVHHPHPPGFPVWIAAADLLHACGLSEFHALQALAMLGAIVLVPATFLLCRELRMPFATSLGAASLLAFFPNVWLYGGTGLSDVPSMTLVVVALALLFRGCHDRRAYFAGAIVLAIAAGVRPQNLLIGFAPALIASACRLSCRRAGVPPAGQAASSPPSVSGAETAPGQPARRRRATREIAFAALVGALIAGAAYGIAIEKTGWQAYRETVRLHGQYISAVDSFRSPGRPPLYRVFLDFFVRPYRMPFVNVALTLLATISFVAGSVKRRPHVVVMLAAFGPFCLFAWLMLDRFSASRFSIGYAPLIAILAADGAALAFRRFAPAAVALLVAVMIVWTWPALRVVRTTDSPPVAAIRWIERNAGRAAPLYVHGSMAPYAEALLQGHAVQVVSAPPVQLLGGQDALYLREDASPGARNFTREHGHLWWIARQRYFEVSVRPLTARAAMADGWYGEEGSGAAHWRWMGRRATIVLPPAGSPRAHLTLAFYVPLDLLGGAPTVTVMLNGTRIAQVRATDSELTIERDVPAGAANELVIETDRTVQPPHDGRVLGLRLNEIGWL